MKQGIAQIDQWYIRMANDVPVSGCQDRQLMCIIRIADGSQAFPFLNSHTETFGPYK